MPKVVGDDLGTLLADAVTLDVERGQLPEVFGNRLSTLLANAVK